MKAMETKAKKKISKDNVLIFFLKKPCIAVGFDFLHFTVCCN